MADDGFTHPKRPNWKPQDTFAKDPFEAKEWKLPVFLNLIDDAFRLRTVVILGALLLYCMIVFSIITVRSPSVPTVSEVAFVVAPYSVIENGRPFSDSRPPAVRILDQYGMGMSDVEVKATIKSFRAESATHPCNTDRIKRNEGTIAGERYSNYCSTTLVNNVRTTTNSSGIAIFNDLKLEDSIPGLYTIRFGANGVYTQHEIEVTSRVVAVNYPVTPDGVEAPIPGNCDWAPAGEACLTLRYGQPIPEFKVKLQDMKRDGVEGIYVHAVAMSSYEFGKPEPYYFPMANKYARLSGAVSELSDNDGFATFKNLTIVGSNTPYLYIHFFAEGTAGTWHRKPYQAIRVQGEDDGAVASVSLSFPGEDQIVSVVEGQPLGNNTIKVIAKDKDNKLLSNRHCIAMITGANYFRKPALHVVDFGFDEKVLVAKQLVNAVAITGADGLAVFDDLAFNTDGPAGNHTVTVSCDGVFLEPDKEAIYEVKSTVFAVTYQTLFPSEPSLIVGSSISPVLAVKVQNEFGQGISGKVIREVKLCRDVEKVCSPLPEDEVISFTFDKYVMSTADGYLAADIKLTVLKPELIANNEKYRISIQVDGVMSEPSPAFKISHTAAAASTCGVLIFSEYWSPGDVAETSADTTDLTVMLFNERGEKVNLSGLGVVIASEEFYRIPFMFDFSTESGVRESLALGNNKMRMYVSATDANGEATFEKLTPIYAPPGYSTFKLAALAIDPQTGEEACSSPVPNTILITPRANHVKLTAVPSEPVNGERNVALTVTNKDGNGVDAQVQMIIIDYPSYIDTYIDSVKGAIDSPADDGRWFPAVCGAFWNTDLGGYAITAYYSSCDDSGAPTGAPLTDKADADGRWSYDKLRINAGYPGVYTMVVWVEGTFSMPFSFMHRSEVGQLIISRQPAATDIGLGEGLDTTPQVIVRGANGSPLGGYRVRVSLVPASAPPADESSCKDLQKAAEDGKLIFDIENSVVIAADGEIYSSFNTSTVGVLDWDEEAGLSKLDCVVAGDSVVPFADPSQGGRLLRPTTFSTRSDPATGIVDWPYLVFDKSVGPIRKPGWQEEKICYDLQFDIGEAPNEHTQRTTGAPVCVTNDLDISMSTSDDYTPSSIIVPDTPMQQPFKIKISRSSGKDLPKVKGVDRDDKDKEFFFLESSIFPTRYVNLATQVGLATVDWSDPKALSRYLFEDFDTVVPLGFDVLDALKDASCWPTGISAIPPEAVGKAPTTVLDFVTQPACTTKFQAKSAEITFTNFQTLIGSTEDRIAFGFESGGAISVSTPALRVRRKPSSISISLEQSTTEVGKMFVLKVRADARSWVRAKLTSKTVSKYGASLAVEGTEVRTNSEGSAEMSLVIKSGASASDYLLYVETSDGSVASPKSSPLKVVNPIADIEIEKLPCDGMCDISVKGTSVREVTQTFDEVKLIPRNENGDALVVSSTEVFLLIVEKEATSTLGKAKEELETFIRILVGQEDGPNTKDAKNNAKVESFEAVTDPMNVNSGVTIKNLKISFDNEGVFYVGFRVNGIATSGWLEVDVQPQSKEDAKLLSKIDLALSCTIVAFVFVGNAMEHDWKWVIFSIGAALGGVVVAVSSFSKEENTARIVAVLITDALLVLSLLLLAILSLSKVQRRFHGNMKREKYLGYTRAVLSEAHRRDHPKEKDGSLKKPFFYPTRILIAFVLTQLTMFGLGYQAMTIVWKVESSIENLEARVLTSLTTLIEKLVSLDPFYVLGEEVAEFYAAIDRIYVELNSLSNSLRDVLTVGIVFSVIAFLASWVMLLYDFRKQVFAIRKGNSQVVMYDPDPDTTKARKKEVKAQKKRLLDSDERSDVQNYEAPLLEKSRTILIDERVHFADACNYTGIQISNAIVSFYVVMFLVALTLLPLRWELLRNFILGYWRVVLILLIPTVINILFKKLVAYKFLTSKEGIKFESRRIFFAYDMAQLFLQMLTGFVTALVRFAMVSVVTLLSLSRVHTSLFPAWVERYLLLDTGNKAYQAMLLQEKWYNHPMVLAATDIILQDIEERKKQSEAGEMRTSVRNRQLQFRWYLALTLHNNPKLRRFRRRALDLIEHENSKLMRAIETGTIAETFPDPN